MIIRVKSSSKPRNPVIQLIDRLVILAMVVMVIWIVKLTCDIFESSSIWKDQRERSSLQVATKKSPTDSEKEISAPDSKRTQKENSVKPEKRKSKENNNSLNAKRQVTFAYIEGGDGGLTQDDLAYLFPNVIKEQPSNGSSGSKSITGKISDNGNVSTGVVRESASTLNQDTASKIGIATKNTNGAVPGLVIDRVADGSTLTDYANRYGWTLIATKDLGNTALGQIDLKSMTLKSVEQGFLDLLSRRAISAEGIEEAWMIKSRVAKSLKINIEDIILVYLTPLEHENSFVVTQLHSVRAAGFQPEEVEYTVANLVDRSTGKPGLEIIRLEKR